MCQYLLLFIFVWTFSGCVHSSPNIQQKKRSSTQSQLHTFEVQEVTSGLGVIWGFDFLSPTRIIVTERKGAMSILDLESKKITPLKGIPKVRHRGQGGLLDVVLSPHFASDNYVYFSYSAIQDSSYTTRLSRAKLLGNRLGKEEVLFSALPYFSSTHHYGGRITFDRSGHVFLSVGDRGHRDKAQALKTHNGKIIRLTLDGKTPLSNPFIKKQNALKEIWSYGHRNPQGMFFDLSTNRLWVQEHGPRGGDEINWVRAGLNYGWPIITYGREYSGFKVGDGLTEKKGMEQPVKYYVPSIAPSGLIVYSGKKFPKWKGHLFSGALALRHLNRITVPSQTDTHPAEEKLLENLAERIRNVKEGPEGFIWVSTDSGQLIRLL